MGRLSISSIAIIPDGNRRFAAKHSMPLHVAYAKGFEKVNEAVEWAAEKKVQKMTFWALSLENFTRRSSLELKVLFTLMRDKMTDALRSPELTDNDARIRFFGRIDRLPTQVKDLAHKIEGETASRKGIELNIGVAYSGQDEILRAAGAMARDVATGKLSQQQLESMPASQFSQYLYTPLAPDLVIRTGGVHRLSGFMPFQSAYSEYFFSPKLWPEFSKRDFSKAVQSFQDTQRRFGK